MTDVERLLVRENDAIRGAYSDMVNVRIRERYSVSEELALLRQKDVKAEEFAEYYEYCEQCKVEAKAELIGDGSVIGGIE